MVGNAWIQSLPMIGFPYSIGVFGDMYGREWNSGNGITTYNRMEKTDPHPSHFTKLYKCDDHLLIGEIIMVSVVMAIIISVLSVACSMLVISKGNTSSAMLSLCLQGILTIIFAVIVFQSSLIFSYPYTCHEYPSLVMGLSAVSIRFSDIFEISYAIPLFGICLLIGCFNIILIVSSGVFRSEPSYKRIVDIRVQ